MNRTSSSQFEVMVNFMERNGDLNKRADNPHGRLANLTKWDELESVLNMDTSGSVRTGDKRKKPFQSIESNTEPEEPQMQVQLEEVNLRPHHSGLTTPLPVVVEEAGVVSQSQHHAVSLPRRLSASPRRPLPPLSEPRRRAQRRLLQRSSRVDSAADHFATSDNAWRSLATEFVTENRRLRERELEQQSQWQILFARCLDIAERYLSQRN